MRLIFLLVALISLNALAAVNEVLPGCEILLCYQKGF